MEKFKYYLGVVVVCLVLSSTAMAGHKDKPKKEAELKPSNVRPIKLNLVPYFIGGYVLGEAGRYIMDYDGSSGDKLIYGGGVSLDYYHTSRLMFGANFDYLWWNPSSEWFLSSARSSSYSLSVAYHFRDLKSNNPYCKLQIGVTSAKPPEEYSNLEFGSHPFYKFSLGTYTFFRAYTTGRIELYYRRILSEGGDMDGLWFMSSIPFDVETFGLEIGIGFPLITGD